MSLQAAYKHFEEGEEEALTWLRGETSGLRTGRVKPDFVTNLQVEHYGARNPLQSLASVSSADARTLTITPYDPGAVQAIEKAVTEANLGVNPVVDGKVVRLSFPSLTEEVREQTIRMLHNKAEEARVRLRQTRDEALRVVREEKTDGKLSEDEFYDGKAELDERIDKANKAIEELIQKKEEEIRTI